MKNRYKISELAKIFNISRQTLIFYHKKNILIPSIVDKNNGYRYYSSEQIWELFFIITLKKAGLSLEEIKKFTEIKSPIENIKFLENKVEEIDNKISEFLKIKENITRKINILKKSSVDLENKIYSGENKRIRGYFISMVNEKDEAEMAMNYEKLHSIAKKKGIRDIKYITITNIREQEKDKIIPVKKIGIVIPEKIKMDKIEEIVLEKYFYIKYNDTYINLQDNYKELKKYIESKGYISNDYGIEIAEDYSLVTEKGFAGIFEILVGIKKRIE
ncbi:MerR family transcriptional regulator [Fusobacterium sp.]|uniref:MerR family transcriptional regulator n=1 Tax=Fusobacterium sp. TaxID=68766 RepID=UPI00262A6E96|nr:MerR family transcriptional regulator [Fusobacterium sp.]